MCSENKQFISNLHFLKSRNILYSVSTCASRMQYTSLAKTIVVVLLHYANIPMHYVEIFKGCKNGYFKMVILQ